MLLLIISQKLVKIKANSKYFIGYLDKDIRHLVLTMSKMNGYVKTFKFEDKNSKLMSFRIDDEKLLDLKDIELNAFPVYDVHSRYIKTKIRTYGDKFYTILRDLNVPEDNIQSESFTVISIDSLLVYDNKYYLQVYLDNCAYKVVNKQMTDYLDRNLLKI